MKILIITQKVNKEDSTLGFFHRWIEEFCKHYDFVTVLCLEKGVYDLPNNCDVISLGKESNKSKFSILYNFYRIIISERKSYDFVFVHMNPIYLALGGIVWKIMRKKTALWYTHKSVDYKLKIGSFFADIIFTASKESFGISNRKVNIVGHGIDTDLITPRHKLSYDNTNVLNIVHVGRISRIKNCHILIEAISILKREFKVNATANFIGDTVYNEDEVYKKELLRLIKESNLEDIVYFTKGVSQSSLVEYYNNAHMTVNMSPTGGMDKSVLESMSCETLVLSSNKTFVGVFGNLAPDLIFEENNSRDLAYKINRLCRNDNKDVISKQLRNIALRNFSITDLVNRLCIKMKS